MLVYEVDIPALAEEMKKEVVSRRLHVLADGVATNVPIALDATVAEFAVKDDQIVSVSLIDTDNAQNDSDPSDPVVFTAKDTIPPAKPGQLTVRLAREIPDPDPEPVPEPAPEPTPEPAPEPVPDSPPAGDGDEPTPEPAPEPVPDSPPAGDG